MITKIALALALASTMAAPFAEPAEAAPFGIAGAPAGLAPVEEAQFAFGGRNFCFYSNGWSGPGWYWCGFAARRGMGFGGGDGWRGWDRGGGRRYEGGGGGRRYEGNGGGRRYEGGGGGRYGGGRYEGDGRGAGVGGNPGPNMSHGKGVGEPPVYPH